MGQPQATEFVIVNSTELRALSADSKSIGRCPFFFMSDLLHPFLGYLQFPARCLLAFLVEIVLQPAQKDLRGEARDLSTSGGVHSPYVVARRLSTTLHMSLFQRVCKALGERFPCTIAHLG